MPASFCSCATTFPSTDILNSQFLVIAITVAGVNDYGEVLRKTLSMPDFIQFMPPSPRELFLQGLQRGILPGGVFTRKKELPVLPNILA